jgi:hypothetical protein
VAIAVQERRVAVERETGRADARVIAFVVVLVASIHVVSFRGAIDWGELLWQEALEEFENVAELQAQKRAMAIWVELMEGPIPPAFWVSVLLEHSPLTRDGA